MSIKANIKVGGATIQVEADKQVSLVEQAGFWGECPDKCGKCDSGNIGFFSRNPGGNLYVGLKCKNCKAEFNFGQNKEGGKLYIKQDAEWNAEFKGNGGGQATQNYGDDTQGNNQMDDDDIPY